METAVVLRQREVQQLQRLVKKLAGLVDRLAASATTDARPFVTRKRTKRVATPPVEP